MGNTDGVKCLSFQIKNHLSVSNNMTTKIDFSIRSFKKTEKRGSLLYWGIQMELNV